MRKTTATVTHRDSVPYGCLAYEFCDVEFSGYRSSEMIQKWRDITHKRFNEYNSIYEENKINIQNLHNQLNTIQTQIKTLINSKPTRPFYRFWYNKDEKEKVLEINKSLNELSKQKKELLSQIHKLEKQNEVVKAQRYFDFYECYEEITFFLRQNGFVLTDVSYNRNRYVPDTDIFSCDKRCLHESTCWIDEKECCTEIEVWTLEE